MRAALIVILGALLAGCSASTSPMGVGNSVYSADFGQELVKEEIYAGLICESGALPTMRAASGAPRCDYQQLSSTDWADFVNAGMVDIDRRCDAYLAWLFDLRQSKKPILAQLNRTQGLTRVAGRAFGVGQLAIDIAVEALGYASDTFSNFDPNMMLGIESSTIQTVVLDRQRTAKSSIYALQIRSRPQAMQALRGYLRVCMPHTILTDVNTLLVADASGALRRDVVVEISPETTGAITPLSPVSSNDQIIIPSTNAAVVAMFEETNNKFLVDVIRVQETLCDKNPDGTFGNNSKLIIYVLEQNTGFPGFRANGKISEVEYRHIGDLRDRWPERCNTTLYHNSYERDFFSNAADFKLIVRDILKLKPDSLPKDVAYTDDAFPRAKLREIVRQLRSEGKIEEDPLVPLDQITPRIRTQLLNGGLQS